MGFCAMFPWLCGIGKSAATEKFAETVAMMKQTVLPVSTALDNVLDTEINIPQRMLHIERARAEATAMLTQAGLNPYAL